MNGKKNATDHPRTITKAITYGQWEYQMVNKRVNEAEEICQ